MEMDSMLIIPDLRIQNTGKEEDYLLRLPSSINSESLTGKLFNTFCNDNSIKIKIRHFSIVSNIFLYLYRGEAIPRVKYTPEEVKTWKTIYTSLRPLYDRYASSEFNRNLKELEQYCAYRYIFFHLISLQKLECTRTSNSP